MELKYVSIPDRHNIQEVINWCAMNDINAIYVGRAWYELRLSPDQNSEELEVMFKLKWS